MLSSAATYGLGWTVKQVKIRELDSRRSVARCVDTEGQILDVATSVQRTGIRPQVGQTWLVDRDLAVWTLKALVNLGETTAIPAMTTPWAPVALSGGWAASADTGDAPPMARVTADGWVELSGVISDGTASPGEPVTVARLPIGFPSTYRANTTLCCQLVNGYAHVRGLLPGDGTAVIQVPAAFTPTWVDLTNLRARVRE